MSNRPKLRPAPRQTFVDRSRNGQPTRWNGEPVTAVRVAVRVADAPEFPEYWARQHVNTIRQAVRVEYYGSTFYLDNEDGSGWYKVTHGGGPRLPHRDLAVLLEVPDATVGDRP